MRTWCGAINEESASRRVKKSRDEGKGWTELILNRASLKTTLWVVGGKRGWGGGVQLRRRGEKIQGSRGGDGRVHDLIETGPRAA